MTLAELVSSIPDFSGWNFTQKVRLFAWHVQTHRGMARFQPADVQRCFSELSLDAPVNVRGVLADLAKRKPRELLSSTDGYCLEKRIKDDFDTKYGQRSATIAVHKLLAELPARITNADQREYLGQSHQSRDPELCPLSSAIVFLRRGGGSSPASPASASTHSCRQILQRMAETRH